VKSLAFSLYIVINVIAVKAYLRSKKRKLCSTGVVAFSSEAGPGKVIGF
jgi:hypothetical protein